MTLASTSKTTAKLEHIFVTFEQLEPKEKAFLIQSSDWKIFKTFEEMILNKSSLLEKPPVKFSSREISNAELFFNSLKQRSSFQSNICKNGLTKQIEQIIEKHFPMIIPKKLTTKGNSSIVHLPHKTSLITDLSKIYEVILKDPMYTYIRPLYIEKLDSTTAKILRQTADLLDTRDLSNSELKTYIKIKFSAFSDDEIFFTINFLKEFQRILNTTNSQISLPTEAAMNIALRSATLFSCWETLLKNNSDPEIQYAVTYLKAIEEALNIF